MKNFGKKKSCICLQKFWFCSHFLQTEVRGKFHSLWVKICWSWNSNNRNIVTGQAEFIAGDWLTWWSFKFRLYAKKYYQILFLKVLKIFRKYFHFDFWSIFHFQKIFLRFRYFRFRYLRFPKDKIENFQIFRFWKMNIFSQIFQNFLK